MSEIEELYKWFYGEASTNELNKLAEALEEHFKTLIKSVNNKDNKYNFRDRVTKLYIPKNKLNKNIIIRRKK